MKHFTISRQQYPHQGKGRGVGGFAKKALCVGTLLLGSYFHASAQSVSYDGINYGVVDDTCAYVSYSNPNIETADIKEFVEIRGSRYRVTTVRYQGFKDCSKLKTVVFPESMRNISEAAFRNCTALESITFPKSIESIGDYAFAGCHRLGSVEFPNFSNDSTNISDRDTTGTVGGDSTITEIPDSTGVIGGDSAMRSRIFVRGLADIHTVTIGVSAFSQCFSLKSIELPDGLAELKRLTFSGCDELSEVKLPSTLASIENYAFSGCSSITRIDVPKSVETIADYAFSEMANCKAINVEEGNANYSSSDGILLSGDGTQVVKCPEGKAEGVGVPEGVKKINSGAFANNASLTDVVLPESVEKIDNFAFLGCPNIRRIFLSKNVRSIGSNVFTGLEALEAIDVDAANANFSSKDGVLFSKDGEMLYRYPAGKAGDYAIPEGTKGIYYASFGETARLTSIKVPASLESFAPEAFDGWSRNLKSVDVDADNQTYKSVDGVVFSKDGYMIVFYPSGKSETYNVPQGTMTIGEWAAQDCILDSIVIPSSVNWFKEYAMAYCGFRTLSIPCSDENATVGSIDEYAFLGCESLEELYVPYLNEIKEGAFTSCNSLKSITRFIVGNVDENAFNGVDKENCVLYVPQGMTAEFRSNAAWGQFANIVEIDVTGIENIKAENGAKITSEGGTINFNGIADGTSVKVFSADGATVYSGTAKQFTPVTAGTYIVVVGNKTFKVLVK